MYDTFAFVALVCAGVNLALASFIYHQDPDQQINRLAALRCLAFGLMLFVNFQFRAAGSFPVAVFWQKVFVLAAFPFQAVHFHFVWSLFFQGKRHTFFPYRLVLLIVYSSTVLLALWNSFFDIIGTPVKKAAYWTINTADISWGARGALAYVAIINLVWIGLSLALFWSRQSHIAKRQHIFIVLGLVFPVLFDTLINAIPPLLGKTSVLIDISPIYYTVGSLVLIYGIARYHVFTITLPAAAREIVLAMSEGMILVTPQGIIQAVNPSMCTLTGYSEEDLVGKPLATFIGTESDPFDHDDLLALLQQGTIHNIEKTCTTRHGKLVSLLFSGSVVRSRRGAGTILGIVYTVLDITLRKQAEDVLRESGAMYRSMFEKNMAIKLLIDPTTGAIVDANPAACTFYGYRLEVLRTKNITDMNTLHPDQIHAEMELARTEQRSQFLFRHRLASGKLRDVEVYSSPITFRDQTFLFSIVHDITDLVQTEHALRESEQRFRLIAEHAPDIIFRYRLTTPQGYEYISPSVTAIMGYTPEDFYADAMLDLKLLHPNVRPQMAVLPREDSTSREPIMLPYINKYGKEVWIEQRHWIVRDEFDHPIAIEGIYLDMTERKRMENELERSVSLLRAIIESTADGILVVGPQMNVLDYNQRFKRLWNLPVGWETMLSSDERLNFLAQQVKDPETFTRRVYSLYPTIEASAFDTIEMKDGRIFERYTAPYRVAGEIAGRVWNFRDQTERYQTEAALQFANQQLTRWNLELEQYNRDITLLNGMGDALQSCKSVEQAYRVVKSFVMQLFPHHAGTLSIFNPTNDLFEVASSWGDPPSSGTFALFDCLVLRQEKVHFFDESNANHPCLHPDEKGNPTLQPSVCVPLTSQSEPLGVLCLYGPPIAQSQEKDRQGRLIMMLAEHLTLSLTNLMLRERLHHLSIHDPLTELFNRRYLDDSLERELLQATHYHYSIGIIMLDIDHFKRFNDTYGHKAGDSLLQALAKFLQSNIRGEDIACRYGGEEFTLILPGASLDNTRKRAQMLCEKIRELQVVHHGKPLGKITLSLGVSCFPDHGTTSEAVIGAADDALYQAKHAGRNRVCVSGQVAQSAPPLPE